MDTLNIIFTVFTVIALVVIGVGLLLTKKPLTEFLQAKMTKENYENLMNIAKTGVRWAKVWLDGQPGEIKKREVVLYVTEKAIEYGLTISNEDIDKAIESAYEQL